MTVAAVAAVIIPEIRSWHRYGKLRGEGNGDGGDQPSASWLDSLTVPKRWFILFYVLGFVWTVLLIVTKGLIVAIPLEYTVCEDGSARQFTNFHPIPLLIYLGHLTRRLIEEFISPPSNAQMHVAGFLVGASFYGFFPLALASSVATADTFEPISFGLGLGLFAFGSWHQYVCHKILRELRGRGGISGNYGLPQGDWFKWSSSPHYLAEIVLYVGLAFICYSFGSVPIDLIMGVAFTSINLCITGARTHEWYLRRFPEEYKKQRRWKVIPYVF